MSARARRRRVLAALLVVSGLLGTYLISRPASPRPTLAAAQRPGDVPTSAPSLRARPAQTAPAQSQTTDAFRPRGAVLLPVATQNQLPALGNGCEVTSLSMLLSAVGRPVAKEVLARQQSTNAAAPVFSRPRDFYSITRWGNPNRAFVGEVDGYGYGIYHGPLTRLLRSKVGTRAVDMSGGGFSQVMDRIRGGVPVMVWTTTTMRPPRQWVTWQTTDGPFRATQVEHAVLLIGWTSSHLIINNPLTGRRQAVLPGPFIEAWSQMGRQAVTVSSS